MMEFVSHKTIIEETRVLYQFLPELGMRALDKNKKQVFL